MKSKERVYRTIHFKEPDRLPIFYTFEEGFVRRYKNELKKFLKDYPSDFAFDGSVNFQIQEQEEEIYPRKYKDEWGCEWLDLLPGIMGEVKEPPLKDWNQLRNFQVPALPYENKENFKLLESAIKEKHAQGYYVTIWGPFRGGFNLFERMQWLRGVENFFIDLMENKDKIKELAEIITEEYLLKGAYYLIKAGVDGFFLADDWGSQKNLLISPAMWREIFKPRYRRVIEYIHSQGKDVFFHSDGYIMQIIPDLIEIGVDVLNPQFSCMSLEELARVCKGKICILADVDRQYILPYGKDYEIRDYVKNMIETLSTQEGGLILRGSVSSIDPLKNVKTMYKSFWEFGNNYRQLTKIGK